MPLIMGGVSLAAGLGGGLLGGAASKKAAGAAQAAQLAALEQARQLIAQVGLPPDTSVPIILDLFKQQGILTPELEQSIKLEGSKVAQNQTDPALRGMQMNALKEMSKRGRAGLTAEDRATYNQSRQNVQKDLDASQQQTIQNLAMRGQAGGGAEIAARLMSSQNAADRASEEGDRISADAAAKAIQALSNSSNMAGSLRGQDFSEENTRAQAADEFNRFNVQSQIDRQTRNVGSQNAAQATNLAQKQQTANQNTSQANNERYRQAEAKRQYWNDKLNYAQAQAGPIMGMGQTNANAAQQVGQANANMWGSIGGGVAGAASSYGNYLQQSKLLAALKANQAPMQATQLRASNDIDTSGLS